ncbi:YcaO-like family protein [uncultured Tateyamaria sp.]|uniref:YcaO-like family protein n=1 Tax=uncultured Tateyamaria sp. TaxID=455651 RepID=UPI002604F00B|nr:YcaO-like family protein [uncultured Tateyamaria sp.]
MNLEPWDILVSPHTGLVTNLSPQQRGPEEPAPPFLYTAMLAHYDFRNAHAADRINAGKGRTRRDAKLSALGEAVERYCAYHWDHDRVFAARLSDLSGPVITPDELVLYGEDRMNAPGFPYNRWDPDAPIHWVSGKLLPDGQLVTLPASMVYLTQPIAGAGDFFTPATSNGLAAGATLDAAILGGLNELIERDALIITWANRLPCTRIDVPEDAGVSGDILLRYRLMKLQVELFLLPTDQPQSVVLAMATDENPAHPHKVVGMGCRLDPSAAVEQALFELCQARPSEIQRFADRDQTRSYARYEDIETLEDHPAFHALPEHAHETGFLRAGGKTTALLDIPSASTGSVEGDLERTIEGLIAAGSRVAAIDLTLPDVAQAGYRVARTLATGLQPIHFGYREERLGGRRLFDLPVTLGLREQPATPEELNLCPHPMA